MQPLGGAEETGRRLVVPHLSGKNREPVDREDDPLQRPVVPCELQALPAECRGVSAFALFVGNERQVK